jgi:hypothetical protein
VLDGFRRDKIPRIVPILSKLEEAFECHGRTEREIRKIQPTPTVSDGFRPDEIPRILVSNGFRPDEIPRIVPILSKLEEAFESHSRTERDPNHPANTQVLLKPDSELSRTPQASPQVQELGGGHFDIAS